MAKEKNNDQYKVQYSEPVGMIAAQSVGEPGTQMILRSFHFAGIESAIATSGLPRIVELVDAKKKPSTPLSTIYLEGKASKDLGEAEKVAKKISEVKMNTLIRRTVENFSKGTIKFMLNRQELESQQMTPRQVAEKLGRLMKLDSSVEEYTIIVSMHTKNLKDIRSTRVRITRSVINGVEGAGKAIVQRNKSTGEFYIISAGSNIGPIMEIEGVDKSRIYTNDVFAMYAIFGIEGARNVLANELKLTLDEQKISVDYRHLLLIADAMAASGSIKGVGRHGLSGEKSSVFARAAYEETVKHLINAAAFGEIDPMRGVTENILVGKQIPVGTGSVKLAIKKEDMAKVKPK